MIIRLNFLMILGAFFTSALWAQSATPTASDAQIMNELYQAQKKALIAQAMALTEEEAAGFWPIYDEYSADQMELNAEVGAGIQDFANNFEFMTDDKARELRDKWLSLEQRRLDLLVNYVSRFGTVISDVKVFRLIQTLNRIGLNEEAEIAQRIPLMQ